ncbi:stage II sporulation protein M [Natrarchaeobaculum sulfurireducens]|uniref:Stage II sporulation protein M n=1 Tax=Natrarchaeobaculum sulfurireducens TaxID=2044521 RepID=A0A346PAR0_9EURY|nr:stage II sporulation protein M [Natrarchaeobaculum sulfurireducens]AXR76605.1 hypothetical protein AArc1_0261 [Natrarchaeobaculum sulfurireducens]
MSLSDSVAAVVAVFRRRPADLLPLYLLGAAVPAIVRVLPFLAAIIGFVYLETTGRLEAAETAFADLETDVPDPEGEPEAFEAWLLDVGSALEPLATLPLALLVIVTVFVSLFAFVALTAYVSAGQLTACDARLRSERGLVTGIGGVKRYGSTFFGLYVLELLLWLVVGLLIGLPTILLAGTVGLATPLLAIPIVLLGVLAFVAVIAVIRALFAFAPVAVVVDDVGVFGSLPRAGGFVRARPVDATFYYALSVGLLLAMSVVSSVLVLFEVAMVVSLVSVFVVLPALDLLKTALYDRYRGRLHPPAMADRSLRTQFRAGVRRGWKDMSVFVRETIGLHALVVVLGVGSFVGGWLLVDPYTDVLPAAAISARLEGHIPPTAALEFFGNNWLVAITTAYAGVALVIPAIASLLFNGVFIGITARLEAEPLELLAFVIPHGIFEIPAIFVASALGIWLGLVGWRAHKGRIDRQAFADALERAFWVLVGIGILLAVAGFVEGFISPYYWRPFL